MSLSNMEEMSKYVLLFHSKLVINFQIITVSAFTVTILRPSCVFKQHLLLNVPIMPSGHGTFEQKSQKS